MIKHICFSLYCKILKPAVYIFTKRKVNSPVMFEPLYYFFFILTMLNRNLAVTTIIDRTYPFIDKIYCIKLKLKIKKITFMNRFRFQL